MPAKRGRKSYLMGEEHRTKIKNSKIFQRLVEHVEGKTEMSQTQVTVGLALLKKVMPDLSSVEITGNDEAPLNVATTIKLVGVASGSRDQDS